MLLVTQHIRIATTNRGNFFLPIKCYSLIAAVSYFSWEINPIASYHTANIHSNLRLERFKAKNVCFAGDLRPATNEYPWQWFACIRKAVEITLYWTSIIVPNCRNERSESGQSCTQDLKPTHYTFIDVTDTRFSLNLAWLEYVTGGHPQPRSLWSLQSASDIMAAARIETRNIILTRRLNIGYRPSCNGCFQTVCDFLRLEFDIDN